MAVDNQGAIVIIKMDISSRRTKYINIRYHYFREYIEQSIINSYYISTNEMVADNFINMLDRLRFAIFAISIDMHD
jgi:hypothetical protein